MHILQTMLGSDVPFTHEVLSLDYYYFVLLQSLLVCGSELQFCFYACKVSNVRVMYMVVRGGAT